ncbi:glycoside hydrolase family 3 protein [Pedobacter helvus]|uniref:beta-glucosidase n=1 Tax=Pedobacter helvus TaxID=2563444 RepID=A0ABW9JN84_9SPHI|nr:glycoside hydrolase family 3 N-terminal domain-containing protein [Pedobacter ureilyticus]
MIKKISLALAVITTLIFSSYKQEKPLYKDAKQSIEKRIDDLLARMNLQEKVMQLNQYTLGRNDNANNMADPVNGIPAEIGSLIYFGSDADLRNQVQKKAMEQSRLGIPIIFGYDVIHGFRTIYPISLGQACSWNPALVEKACGVAAQEARMSGIDWTFSPMIDVARDGRWGRVAEGYGEDTYTNAIFTVASVKGYQGKDLSSDKNVAACLKHYIGYGASEAGRDYVYSEISNQTLWDTYMPPYEAGVKAGALTLMSSFNDISGTPGSANHYTLTEVLKKRWKHDGFVVSDWGSIEQLRPQGVAANKKEAALKAFTAGVEMDMMNRSYDNHLGDLVKEGKVSEELLNDAVRRVLRVKFKLGLFDRPYTPTTTEKQRFYRPESLKIAEQLAEESIVLLKNKDRALPLTSAKKILVKGYTPQPGDIKYRDLNGDGIINQYDQTTIGSQKPSLFLGARLGFNVGGFDVSALLQGVINQEVYLSGSSYWEFQGGTAQAYQNHLNRFTPSTAATAQYPRLTTNSGPRNGAVNNFVSSSFWLRKGDFLKLRNVELGYTLPAKLTQKIGIKSTRLFANGLNLWTLSSKTFNGADPENFNGTYPIERVFSFGLNIQL